MVSSGSPTINFGCAPTRARGLIVAIRLDRVKVGSTVPELRRVLNRAEAEADGWFNGPPYAVCECVFDEYEQEGCFPVEVGS